jgi:hypothetical protein
MALSEYATPLDSLAKLRCSTAVEGFVAKRDMTGDVIDGYRVPVASRDD